MQNNTVQDKKLKYDKPLTPFQVARAGFRDDDTFHDEPFMIYPASRCGMMNDDTLL